MISARHISRHESQRVPACMSDACCQGERKCPTPEACQLPDRGTPNPMCGAVRWMITRRPGYRWHMVAMFGLGCFAHWVLS